PVSTLPAANLPLSGAEQTYVIQGGVSKKTPVSSIGGVTPAALAAALAAPPPIGGTTPGAVSTRAVIDASDPRYAGGMKCDGATNDTAAFQAGINAAQGLNRRILQLPTGVCLVSGGVTVTKSL